MGFGARDDAVEKNGRCHNDGFRVRLVQLATEGLADDVDPKALTWLLNAPALSIGARFKIDNQQSIPGSTIVQLISTTFTNCGSDS